MYTDGDEDGASRRKSGGKKRSRRRQARRGEEVEEEEEDGEGGEGQKRVRTGGSAGEEASSRSGKAAAGGASAGKGKATGEKRAPAIDFNTPRSDSIMKHVQQVVGEEMIPVNKVLESVNKAVKPAVRRAELDAIIAEMIRVHECFMIDDARDEILRI
jgi:hypothetical protein